MRVALLELIYSYLQIFVLLFTIIYSYVEGRKGFAGTNSQKVHVSFAVKDVGFP